jgi:hypothetical protein
VNAGAVHVLGIRHHCPATARCLLQALAALAPDTLLVEGPPDAAHLLPRLTHPAMRPPVALRVYNSARPAQAVTYPFAIFSPEWQALCYGLHQGITVELLDMPQRYRLADPPPTTAPPADDPRADPLGWLAHAAGHTDGDRWWEWLVMQHAHSTALFDTVLELMAPLRQQAVPDPHEERREAYMRQLIRAAQGAGARRIAVVCGAWHAPALAHMPPAHRESVLLAGRPRVATAAAWVPWSYAQLADHTGYGAGVLAPGWYHHLWYARDTGATDWLAQVAERLDHSGMAITAAQVAQAAHRAAALATQQQRDQPGLDELTIAAQEVFCQGQAARLAAVQQPLLVGEQQGQVPAEE